MLVNFKSRVNVHFNLETLQSTEESGSCQQVYNQSQVQQKMLSENSVTLEITATFSSNPRTKMIFMWH